MLVKNLLLSTARVSLRRSVVPFAVRCNSTSTATKTDTDSANQITSSSFAPSLNVDESGLHQDVRDAFIKRIGPTFTPVQQLSIGEFIDSETGIVVRAKTGTGKTFAFGLPVFHSLMTTKSADVNKSVNTVVVCPTRDLALQNQTSLEKVWLACRPRIRNKNIALVIGQTPIRNTARLFVRDDKPPVVVCTPGRFLDMIKNNRDFRKSFPYLKNIVIDEADELLNQNFKLDIEEMIDTLKSLNETDQVPKTMLFSATMSKDVFDLAQNVMGKGFKFVDTNEGETSEVNENVTQTLIQTESIFQSYVGALKFIIDRIGEKDFKPIVFLSNTISVDFFHELLSKLIRAKNLRYRTAIIHGKLSQGQRNRAQSDFRRYKDSVLVASNVISRGMDFPDVSHVIQIGVNHEISNYTHRIGRTGRAGKEGHALLFSTNTEAPFVKALLQQGNNFESTIAYEKDADFEESVREISSTLNNVDSIVESNLNAYCSIPSTVSRFNKNDIARDCGKLYVDLTGSTELPFLSATLATRNGMNTEAAREYFNIPGNPTSSGNRGGYNRGGNGGYNRGGNGGYNRGGNGGYNRGGYEGGNSSRGGYESSRGGNRYGSGSRSNKRYPSHDRSDRKSGGDDFRSSRRGF
ncbi:hypothetical protein CANARDRAFT_28494 [[Candida] arabinofermentans NRRL YB-2248]|uniref:ATP-dependent RNA helicase n=1 Tax=[Candida] arabinofermentans NRRL YB-2248 TaxID=983967 RepID=A0A1E4T0A9_9ASCO|nr:hypothetical protein CANARDRAFT_28494 [[Candida] arabinofermentans NRRL YB-2248]